MTHGIGDDLVVESEERDGCAVVTAHGTIDYSNVDRLRAAMEKTVDGHPSCLVLDLAGVTFVDSSGLALLLTTDQRARARGGWLRLAAPGRQLSRLLRTTNLDQRLEIYDGVPAAIASGAE